MRLCNERGFDSLRTDSRRLRQQAGWEAAAEESAVRNLTAAKYSG
jgi:hypothetical protein